MCATAKTLGNVLVLKESRYDGKTRIPGGIRYPAEADNGEDDILPRFGRVIAGAWSLRELRCEAACGAGSARSPALALRTCDSFLKINLIIGRMAELVRHRTVPFNGLRE